MTDLFLLSEAQMRRIKPFFPLSHGVPRVDDRRVISGIVFVIRNGLRSVAVPFEDTPVSVIERAADALIEKVKGGSNTPRPLHRFMRARCRTRPMLRPA